DGYLAAIGTRILSGRDFGAADRSGAPRVAIVSQELAERVFRGAPAIGQHFRVRCEREVTPEIEVVGVAANTRVNSLSETAPPIVYLALGQNGPAPPSMNFVLRTEGSPASLIPGVKAAVQ